MPTRAPLPRPTDLPVTGPDVRFHQIYPGADFPRPARTIMPGWLPSKAVKLCPPVTEGSSLGWLLTPPVDFAVRWDGRDSEWTLLADDGEPAAWQSLAGGHRAHLPMASGLRTDVPERRRADLERALPFDVPFIDPNPIMGSDLQIFVGVIASTAPGWAMVVRPLANHPQPDPGLQVFDGILETAWWGGLPPVMIRLHLPDKIHRFHRGVPMALLQPVPVAAYSPEFSRAVSQTSGWDEMPEDMFRRFVATRVERSHSGLQGAYQRRLHSYYRGGHDDDSPDYVG